MKQAKYFQPLFVDTTTEYAIDRSRFPGIDNGEPMLLIHSPTTCPCFEAPSPPVIITPVADHELFNLIESIEDAISDSGVIPPEDTSNPRNPGSSPAGLVMETPVLDKRCRDVILDGFNSEESSPEPPLDTPEICSGDSWSSTDSHPSALMDAEFFPSFCAAEDLSGYFSTICEASLLDIGISRKRRHSTVHEECSKRQRTECINWVADLLEDEADYRWSG